ncbi:MAG: hypothetical protein M3M98_05060 [Nitrospirota bacterium]|nr:hypothetical protein [Nitrospirota bacterium]
MDPPDRDNQGRGRASPDPWALKGRREAVHPVARMGAAAGREVRDRAWDQAPAEAWAPVERLDPAVGWDPVVGWDPAAGPDPAEAEAGEADRHRFRAFGAGNRLFSSSPPRHDG